MQSGEAWRQGLGRGKSWLMPMPVLDGGEGPRPFCVCGERSEVPPSEIHCDAGKLLPSQGCGRQLLLIAKYYGPHVSSYIVE